uniref:Rho termination factor N-terminal domain-containing protein n=1 Tax=viral metagenome TaxID=1070528 RepID=A0A6C0II12_9ZZZZ
MPSLSDIFNPSFFMCLGILVLLTSLIVVYFESKMREQNHKIASMLSLVSSLAEEQNNLRMEVFRMVTTGQTNSVNNFHVDSFPVNNFTSKNENTDLINVSDVEDDSDDSDDDDESNDDESNDSNDSDDDLEENEVIELGDNDIKVLKININNKEIDNDNDFNIEEIDNLEELGENTDDDDDDDDLDESSSSDDDFKEENIVSNNLEEPETPKIDLNAIDFKQISISGLENHLNDNETMDYKKLSLNKLKSVVVEKGLTKDSSKLKKNELLNLLGVK